MNLRDYLHDSLTPASQSDTINERAPSVTFATPLVNTAVVENIEGDRPPPEPPPDNIGDESSVDSTNSNEHDFDKPPPGSMFDPAELDRPISPTTVDAFPIDLKQDQVFQSMMTELPPMPSLMDSITHIVHSPRVFGIGLDERSHVRLMANALGSASDGTKMADGGSNICLTGNLYHLVDVVDLPKPVPLSVAVDDIEQSEDYCVTKRGLLPIVMDDGEVLYQTCFYSKMAAETIISPQAIIDASDIFTSWMQVGYKTGDSRPGKLRFDSDSGLYSKTITLDLRHGLYFTNTDTLTVDAQPLRPITPHVNRINAPPNNRSHLRTTSKYKPTTKAKQLEAEIWAARMGFPGEHQLDVLPSNVTGIPSTLDYHPLRFIDPREEAYIRKQAANRSAERCTERGRKFYMDYGFMRASALDYTKPNKDKDRVVESYDGYSSYLLVVDEASRNAWAFLCKSKDPPIDLIHIFMKRFGLDEGFIRTDQGGELAKCQRFVDAMLREHNYVVEPTGADSASQNGGAERFNDTFAVLTRTLLYSSGLPAQFWSSALVHSVYLNNRRVHSKTEKTPFEGWNGIKPDLKYLKMFGSRVCVKQTGSRRAKLDHHDFRGIFLGYTATDENIEYLDLDTGVVKTCHHAVFDEAWYCQSKRPPGPQLLYDLGLENEEVALSSTGIDPAEQHATYPPLFDETPLCMAPDALPTIDGKWTVPSPCKMIHLPLRTTAAPLPDIPTHAAAATASLPEDPYEDTLFVRGVHSRARDLVSEFNITQEDLHQIYLSPTPYNQAFEEEIDLRRFSADKHPTAGLKFIIQDERLILASIDKSTPAAKIPRWRSRIRGAWLIQINGTLVKSMKDVQAAFRKLHTANAKECTLLFSHPEVRPGISNKGLPIVSREEFTQQHANQLNNRWELPPPETLFDSRPKYDVELSGDVLNYVTCAMKLTRGKLLKRDDWDVWQGSEYLQLDQYDSQGMFGDPVRVDSQESVFNLVWTYVIKAADGRKKARCTCDGSTRAGQVRVLDETYANCVDQTSSRLFYAIAAAENLLIYGSDVSNAFAEAGAPKQGFYIRPDKAFHEWWITHKKRPPIPKGYVIPVLSAMQGHPESPRLWEKHADAILREIGLVPTHHEPCLYSGIINGNRIIFKRQVDDFAVACPDKRTSDILFDMIDDKLSIPLKRQGLLDMFNGMNLVQTRDYIKITSKTYLEKICEKHLDTWMKLPPTENRPVPLPCDPNWQKRFINAVGDTDVKVQNKLANDHKFKYRSGVGEIIYAMTTTRPDISYAAVKLSQFSACPADIHYHGVKATLKYLYATRDDGIHFWRTQPREELKQADPPLINSNKQDLLHKGRPEHDPLLQYSYADSDFATCPRTRRSFGGSCVRLAGGTVGYKTKFQATVADSSTHAEFMAAYDTARMNLFIRSVLWDLGIPQEAATVVYEDNDACTAMANARKPTPRTRHIDIKYFSLCDWVERDMITLERIDTSINLADHATKALSRALFHRHADYILGHVPPAYSHVYANIIGDFESTQPTVDLKLPESFTTPTTAAAARIFAPIDEDVLDNNWAHIVWHR